MGIYWDYHDLYRFFMGFTGIEWDLVGIRWENTGNIMGIVGI